MGHAGAEWPRPLSTGAATRARRRREALCRRRGFRGTRGRRPRRGPAGSGSSSRSSGRTSTFDACGVGAAVRGERRRPGLRPAGGRQVRRGRWRRRRTRRPSGRQARSRAPPTSPPGRTRAVAHERDAVGERERLLAVVATRTTVTPSGRKISATSARSSIAQEGVDVRPRLVEQDELGRRRERAGERDPLLLATGELVRVTAAEAVGGRPVAGICGTRVARASGATMPKPTFSATVRCGKSA